MATLSVFSFDAEGRLIQFDTWLDELQLYLLSDSRDGVSLFDLTSGASLAPPDTADGATRSQWLTRDAAARLAVCNHLPLAERAHFGQHKTARALYDTVVARYSFPATAALGRLILPYLFPELSAFATVADLVTHLHTSDTRYRATLPAEFLTKNPPPMYITLYYIVTRLLDSLSAALLVALLALLSLRGVSPPPLSPLSRLLVLLTSFALRRLGLRLLLVGGAAAAGAREARVVGVAAVEAVGGAVEVAVVVVGVVVGVEALVTTVVAAVVAAVGVVAAALVAAVGVVAGAMVAVGVELFREEVLAVARGGSSSVGRLGVVVAARMSFARVTVLRPCWAELLRSGIALFDLDYDAILAAMYTSSVSAEGDCYLCMPPDLGVEVAALGASESALPSTAPGEAMHTITLDSGASRYFFRNSTTLTPLSAPVPVRMVDPSKGPNHCPFLHCSPVSGGSVRLTVRSSPPLVLYELG
ncbi:unnamed protein product [Closterium sp. NIES-54]